MHKLFIYLNLEQNEFCTSVNYIISEEVTLKGVFIRILKEKFALICCKTPFQTNNKAFKSCNRKKYQQKLNMFPCYILTTMPNTQR